MDPECLKLQWRVPSYLHLDEANHLHGPMEKGLTLEGCMGSVTKVENNPSERSEPATTKEGTVKGTGSQVEGTPRKPVGADSSLAVAHKAEAAK
jgi:hypothetical protein